MWRHPFPECSNWSELFDQSPTHAKKRDAVVQTDLIGIEVDSLQSIQAAWEHNYSRGTQEQVLLSPGYGQEVSDSMPHMHTTESKATDFILQLVRLWQLSSSVTNP